jgi:hypothetical protein
MIGGGRGKNYCKITVKSHTWNLHLWDGWKSHWSCVKDPTGVLIGTVKEMSPRVCDRGKDQIPEIDSLSPACGPPSPASWRLRVVFWGFFRALLRHYQHGSKCTLGFSTSPLQSRPYGVLPPSVPRNKKIFALKDKNLHLNHRISTPNGWSNVIILLKSIVVLSISLLFDISFVFQFRSNR